MWERGSGLRALWGLGRFRAEGLGFRVFGYRGGRSLLEKRVLGIRAFGLLWFCEATEV